MDAVTVPQHTGGQIGQQLILLTALQEVLQRLFPGHKGGRGHIVQRGKLFLQLPGLLLGVALVHIGQKFVFFFQFSQHVLQIDSQQGECAHNEQAGHDHAHGSKGHKAVAEYVVKAFCDVISGIKSSGHCNTHLSRR